MDLTQLNILAAEHTKAPCEMSFRRLYDEAKLVFQVTNRKAIIASRYGDADDADEIFDMTVWKVSKEINVEDFGRRLSKSLRNARIDFIRKERSHRNRFELTIDRDDDAPTSEISNFESAEDIAIQRLKKREDDQRQLIAYLCDPSQVDNVTTLIVTNFPQYDTVNALAKALGMHHETVSRRLHKLARRYDANRFGEVNEYLAV